MSKKILWFDCETSGLDPNRNGLIQLAMIMDIDGEKVDEIQFDILPFPDDIIGYVEVNHKAKEYPEDTWVVVKDAFNDKYLPVTFISVAEVENYIYPLAAIQKINAFLQKHISKFDKNDKAYIGGYNVAFDIAFLSKFYEKCGDKYLGSYINWKQVDVRHCLYMLDFDGVIKLENYKLSTACEFFGIEIQAHNPLSDINATRDLFYYKGKYEKNTDNQTSSESQE